MRNRAPQPHLPGLVSPIIAVAMLQIQAPPAVVRMNIARSGHQATLLRDGRVLVSGGADDDGQAVARAELYNPITGTWSTAQSNLAARFGHAAALVHDGRVLVVGGIASGRSCQPVPLAELYDPMTDRWSPADGVPFAAGRGTVAVTLIDGRVLVAGGATGCGEAVAFAALYDPAGNAWSQTAAMGTARQFHVATLLPDGRVLVSGGAPANDGVAVGAEVYDPQSAAWTPVALRESQPLLGSTCDGYLQTYAWALHPDSLIANATSDDCSSATILPTGRLLVAGGTSFSHTASDATRLTDLASGDPLFSQPLQRARRGHTATRLANGAVLIAGGRAESSRLADTEIYVPELLYRTALAVTLRGGLDRSGAFHFGSPLATSMTSRGHVLISYGGGDPPTRILEWDPRVPRPVRGSGRHVYVQEIGHGFDEFHSIRIGRQDDVWAVSATGQEVVHFGPDGSPLLRFGRKPEDADVEPDRTGAALLRPYLEKPMDIAWDRNGNLFVADNGEQPRLLKYDGAGRLLAATGGRGSAPGRLNAPHSLATDANGNVYVADGGNARIQVFDNSLRWRAAYYGMGTPWAMCIAKGRHEYLYSGSNPGASDSRRHQLTVGEVYRLELDGTILGKVVGQDASRGRFPILHHMECRKANEVFAVGIEDSMPQSIALTK